MNKKYTAEELDLLHTELYDILGETIRVCQKHDIPYFVIGGTAIGALYDQGILPWDDDIDDWSNRYESVFSFVMRCSIVWYLLN